MSATLQNHLLVARMLPIATDVIFVRPCGSRIDLPEVYELRKANELPQEMKNCKLTVPDNIT